MTFAYLMPGSSGRRLALAVTAVIAAVGVTIVAQDPSAGARGGRGRGAAPPNPLGQPLLDPAGHVRDDAMVHAPLPAGEAQYADLDGRHMKEVVKDFVAISRRNRDAGEVFWGRNVGTAGHAEAQDWTEAYFAKVGLQKIHRQSFDLRPQWFPAKGWEVSFTSGGRSYTFQSARPAYGMPSTPSGGLTLDLAWAGMGTAADFAGRDVKGKAVLIQDILTPGVLNRWINNEGAVQRAIDNGAAAIGIVYGVADNFALWEGARTGPGFNVGFDDGKVLRELLGKGQPVKVTLKVSGEMRPGLKTASVLGTLPGTTDEEIIVMAHMDGYFDGAIDNASGIAVMMGLAEHFAKTPQARRRRSIRFMGSAGHHGGPGASWLHDSKDTELAKTVLMINLEHVAAVRTKYWGSKLRMTTAVSPMRWWVYGSKELLEVALTSFSRFNVGITADMDTGASGEMGAVARDAPSIQVITSPEPKHTEQDGVEWVPANGLEQIARAYARIIDEVNKLDRRQLLPPAPGTNSAGARQP
jgi:peptidase M28-like protein